MQPTFTNSRDLQNHIESLLGSEGSPELAEEMCSILMISEHIHNDGLNVWMSEEITPAQWLEYLAEAWDRLNEGDS